MAWLCTFALAAILVAVCSDNAWLQFFKDIFVSVAAFFGLRYSILWFTDFIAANPEQPVIRFYGGR